MEWIKYPRLILIIAFSIATEISSAEPISGQFQNAFEGVEDFSVSRTDFGRYELILGELIYTYPSSPEEVEGFKASKSQVFEGRIDRKVFDLQSGVGSLKAYSVIERILQDNGFNIAFNCEEISCGSVKSWSTFYPDQIDGMQSNQYYLAGIYPENGPPERVVSVHASMVGGRARVTIDEVTLLVDVDRAIQSYANAVMDYWSEHGFEKGLPVSGFGLGSYELTTSMKLKYRAIAKVIESNPNVSINLLGYTDHVGEESANKNLSLMRAKSASEFLRAQGVPEESMDFEGLGIFNYSNSEEFRVAPQHRKVMVVAAPATAFSGLN